MSNANEAPFDIAFPPRNACICLDLQRAARAVARRFDAAFRPLDLTNGQFSLLMGHGSLPRSLQRIVVVNECWTINNRSMPRRALQRGIHMIKQ